MSGRGERKEKKCSSSRVQYHVQTRSSGGGKKKEKGKPITKLALEGEFTYSQACLDNSTASGSTVILPSIAITHASPSKNARDQGDYCYEDLESGSRRGSNSNYKENDTENLDTENLDRNREGTVSTLSENEVIMRFSDKIPTVIKSNVSKKSSVASCNQNQLANPVSNQNASHLSGCYLSAGVTRENSGSATQYFNDDDLRSTLKGIILPRLTDNFNDSHLEAAYQRYSHRQRQKSLLILHILDVVLKISFLIALMIRLRESSGRIRVPVKELIIIIPWIVANASTIGLITCWNKCANNYLHLAALLSCLTFNLEGNVLGNCIRGLYFYLEQIWAIYFNLNKIQRNSGTAF